MIAARPTGLADRGLRCHVDGEKPTALTLPEPSNGCPAPTIIAGSI